MTETADIQERFTNGGVIGLNVLVGLSTVALAPFVLSSMLSVGIPSGRPDALAMGFFLALLLTPLVTFSLAYYGYTERE